MTSAGAWRWVGVAALSLSCSGAQWERREAGLLELPSSIYVLVNISDQVDNDDYQGAVAILVDDLLDELRDRNVEAQLVTNRADARRLPGLELFVRAWAPGNRVMRPLPKGKASMVVDCYWVSLRGEKPVYLGSVRGWVTGGLITGGDRMSAPEKAAATIVDGLVVRH